MGLIHMDYLTLFGLFSVTAMLVFYALEDRNPLFILAFAVACALGSAYGFLQGAWPFGVIEARIRSPVGITPWLPLEFTVTRLVVPATVSRT